MTEKEKAQILSINMTNEPPRLYKEVWIGLGGTRSAVYTTDRKTTKNFVNTRKPLSGDKYIHSIAVKARCGVA